MTGSSLKGAQLARSLHMSQRFNVLYVNNPKVACSSIKLTMQKAELDDDSYTPKTSVHEHATSPLLTYPEINVETALRESAFTFSFVRNPFDRLISAYQNKIVVPQKNGRLREHAGFAKDYCPTFEEFVLSICSHDPTAMNPHWRPQALNLSIGLISYDFIGKMETFDADWAVVSHKTNLPKQVSIAGARTRLWAKERPDFTNSAKTAVRKAFAIDFEAFEINPTLS